MPTFNCFNCQEPTSFMGGRGLCEECCRAARTAQEGIVNFADRDAAAQQALAERHKASSQRIIDPMAAQ